MELRTILNGEQEYIHSDDVFLLNDNLKQEIKKLQAQLDGAIMWLGRYIYRNGNISDYYGNAEEFYKKLKIQGGE
jgi:hypothetical protein